jgi:hypothetical protein
MGDNFGFVPPFLKNFKGMLIHLKTTVFTIEEKKRVDLVVKNDFLRAYIK